MKLKGLFAAAVVAAAPMTALAELSAISDAEMSAMTGQDGVSIAIEPGLILDIGSIVWNDDEGGTTATGGSVAFTDIVIGGSTAGGGVYKGVNPLIISVNDPLTIDVVRRDVTVGAGSTAVTTSTPMVAIGLPAGGITLTVKIDNIKLGTDEANALAATTGFGGISVNNLTLPNLGVKPSVLLFTH